MKSHINLMLADHSVREFTQYEQVVLYWYPFRRNLYVARVVRQNIIFEIKILYYQNIIRYIEQCREMKIPNRPIAEMEQILVDNNYLRINEQILASPGFISNDELRDNILIHGANFRYLLDLSDRKKSVESLAKFANKLRDLEEEYAIFSADSSSGAFPGAKIWLRELDQLAEVIHYGRKTNWQYEAFGKYQFAKPDAKMIHQLINGKKKK